MPDATITGFGRVTDPTATDMSTVTASPKPVLLYKARALARALYNRTGSGQARAAHEALTPAWYSWRLRTAGVWAAVSAMPLAAASAAAAVVNNGTRLRPAAERM